MKTLGVYEKTLLVYVYVNVLVDANELDDEDDNGELADVSADIRTDVSADIRTDVSADIFLFFFLFYILIHYLINK